MRTSNRPDPANQGCVFEVAVDDRDFHAAIRPEEIIAEVRYLLAKGIVDRIMVKLGPALDQLLADNQ